jgi:hypothetical protein
VRINSNAVAVATDRDSLIGRMERVLDQLKERAMDGQSEESRMLAEGGHALHSAISNDPLIGRHGDRVMIG